MHARILTPDHIEDRIAAAIADEVRGSGAMKRMARAMAHKSVSAISRQITDSDSRNPIQLRVLLLMRDVAPRSFARVWRKLNGLLGWRTAPEMTPDGISIDIQERIDAARLAWLEMERASIKARQAGLSPIDRKVVRDKIQDLQEELEALHETLETRPVDYLPAIEG